MIYSTTCNKEKNIYLEAMRVIAIFFVIFNHTGSNGYTLFSQEPIGSCKFWVYIFISVFCKFSVPLFFAISGALMLEKQYDHKKLFERIMRIFIVLFIFSFAYYIKRINTNGDPFSFEKFITTFYSHGLWGHLWYLYLYIAYLMGLPFLQALVKSLETKYYYYMIVLALVFRGIIPTIENLFWDRSYTLIGEIKVSWLLSYIVLYPCIGYFLKNKFEITKNKLIFIWIINILGILTSCYLTYCKGISEGILQKTEESFHVRFVVLNCICIFISTKYLFEHNVISDICKKISLSVGSCTFGIYLVHMLIFSYTRNFLNELKEIGFDYMLAALLQSLYVMLLSYFIVYIIKKIPKINRII